MDNTSRILTVIAFYRILLHEAGASGTFGPTGTELQLTTVCESQYKSVQFYYDKSKTDLSWLYSCAI